MDLKDALASIRFKKKPTPIPIPNRNSRPPRSTNYFDLTDHHSLHQNTNSSFTNAPTMVWVNDVGLVNSDQLPSPKPSISNNPKSIPPRLTKPARKCSDLPLAKSIPARFKPTSTSLCHHPNNCLPKTRKLHDIPSPKHTILNIIPSPPYNCKKPMRQKIPTHVSSSSTAPPPKISSPKTKNYAQATDRASTTSSTLSDVHLSTRSPCSDSVSTSVVGGASSSTSLDIFKDMQDTLSMRGISLQTKPINHRINYFDDDNQLEDLTQPENLSFENNQLTDNPESLCPFCDEPLPSKPSSTLANLLEYLKSKPEAMPRSESTNPLGLYLPFSETASCCELHRAERKVIPEGIRKGWPTTIDFHTLPKRIRGFRKYLHRVCTREVDSYFMQIALEEWKTQGPRKVQSVANELATFQVEQPGYYGVRGYEVIYRTLQDTFLKPNRIDSITKLARPLSSDFLLRKVLVPETALCLISEDLALKVNHPQVRETLEDSRSYGTFMFPDQDDRVNSSGERSGLDEDEQEKGQSPRLKRRKPKGLQKSTSYEIEIVHGNELSPRKKPTKSTENKVFPVKKTDRHQRIINGLDDPVKHSKALTINQPKGESALSDGWENTMFD